MRAAASLDEPAADEHQRAPDQETDVPIEPPFWRHGFVDVMQAEDVMVDDPFDQVEDSETHQHRPDQQSGRPAHVHAVRMAPKDRQPEHHEQVRAGMKETVEERIELEISDAVRGVTRARHHVMPLQHLVQDDAVEKTAQAEPEQDAGRSGKVALLSALVHGDQASKPDTAVAHPVR
ncbi:MAG TPA: hypothetical protein VM183_18875 [Burkholderiales bacterium]|nr:hypothetical protein [Burkholderiales bacterium]